GPDRLGDRIETFQAGADRWLFDNKGAHTMRSLDKSECLELPQRRPHRGARHPELSAELGLRGQLRPRRVLVCGQCAAEILGDAGNEGAATGHASSQSSTARPPRAVADDTVRGAGHDVATIY